MNSDGYLSVTDLRALVIGIQFDAADLELDETVKSIMTDSLIGITNLSCPFPQGCCRNPAHPLVQILPQPLSRLYFLPITFL